MQYSFKEEAASFYSGSGAKLAATIYHPSTEDRGPGIVICHGFGARKDERARDIARLLVTKGYRVLTWDYRGFGESEGPRGRVDPFEQIDDGISAAEFLASRSDVDPSKIGLFGNSLGGGVVAGIISRCDWLGCAIATAPSFGGSRRMSGYPEQKSRLLMRAREAIAIRASGGSMPMVDRVELMNPDPEYARQYIGDPHPVALESFYHISCGFEPIDWAPKIKRPFLIVTGSGDKTTPLEDSESFYDALTCEKHFHVFPGGTHGTIYTELLQPLVDLSGSWYLKHMS